MQQHAEEIAKSLGSFVERSGALNAKQTVVARPSNHCTGLARDRLYREGGKRERGMIAGARYDGGCRCKVKIAGLLPRLPLRMAGFVEGGERKGGSLWQ